MSTILGDFSKRISLFLGQKLDGSAYPTWAMQDGVPSGSRSPAWRFCSVPCPWATPGGAAPLSEGGLAMAYAWPTLAWAGPRPTSSHARAVPPYPNTVQEDGLCSARAVHTVGGGVGQAGRHRAPGGQPLGARPPDLRDR